jgi:hypothetical protein
MAYQSDRNRVECALPARLIWDVTKTLQKDNPFHAGVQLMLKDLNDAAREPVDGFPSDKRNSLVRRIEKAAGAVLHSLNLEPQIIVFLSVIFWLRELIDAGTITIPDGSTFDRATNLLLEELNKRLEEWAPLESIANEKARKIAETLRGLGYYP